MLKQVSNGLELEFEAGEDLYNSTKTTIVLLKNATKKLPVTKPRNFLSYCFEFCGLTDMSYRTLRFQIGGRDINPDTIIMSNCLVRVTHTIEFTCLPENTVKTSMYSLMSSGLYSDVILNVKGETFRVHKCILVSRSPKFAAMFSNEMTESATNTVNIEYDKPHLFNLLITWIYCGEIKFADNVYDVFELMLLADEYLLEDFKQKCEEDLIIRVDEKNVLKLLVLLEQTQIQAENLSDICKSKFLEDFEKISKMNPNIEEQLFKVNGLMSKLFLHVHCKKKKRRKVTFASDTESVG
eukprot:TRINITY_DN3006_c0_g1_i4.p1 TRINITY_DN3006_c0_g1~~TRINITY_DN3006_c0_g1_i4.p1  ORF type:complete len:296 (-),score=53.87 TRINITY_DN3006_c0_g1_i4:762-1649(-)